MSEEFEQEINAAVKKQHAKRNPAPEKDPVQDKELQEGIVIIAGGAAYYGNMAAHLAMSIKATDATVKIQLLHHGAALNQLNQQELGLFDTITPIPEHARTSTETGIDKADYFRTKLYLYELSIFKKTIYLDADMIWGKRPAGELFKQLAPLEFTMTNEGSCKMDGTEDGTNKKYTFWMKREAIVSAYMNEPGFLKGKLYQLRSEFIYFEKNEKSRSFFEAAIKVRNELKVVGLKLANRIPDETSFVIAAAMTGCYPHQDQYSPVHWWYIHGLPYGQERGGLLRQYFAFSMGGFRNPKEVRELYKALLQQHAAAIGIPIRHTVGNKEIMVPDRTSM